MPLVVLVDGQAMPEADARAFWQRFSAYMEEHAGDLAGFAASEQLVSVTPVVGPTGPELHGSRTAPQRPYQTAERSRAGRSPIQQPPTSTQPSKKPTRRKR